MLLQLAILTSLKILFVHAAMKEGMILFWLRRIIDSVLQPLPVLLQLWIRKPLYECLFCMSSVWGMLFTIDLWSLTWEYLQFLMAVAGVDYIIQWLVMDEKEEDHGLHT